VNHTDPSGMYYTDGEGHTAVITKKGVLNTTQPPPAPPTHAQINQARKIAWKAAGKFTLYAGILSGILSFLPFIADQLAAASSFFLEASIPWFSDPFTAIIGFGLLALSAIAFGGMGMALTLMRTLPVTIGLYATLSTTFAAQALLPDSMWSQTELIELGERLKGLARTLTVLIAGLNIAVKGILALPAGILSYLGSAKTVLSGIHLSANIDDYIVEMRESI
jgi:hypothetical protein